MYHRTIDSTNWIENHKISLEALAKQAPSTLAVRGASHLTDKYAPISTIDVVNWLMDKGWVVTHARQVQQREDTEERGFQRHMVKLAHPDLILNEEFLQAVLINSFDGRTSYRFSFGIFRHVCSNGIVVGDQLGSFRLKHVKVTNAEVNEISNRMLGGAPKVVKQIEDMRNIELTEVEKGVFAQSAMKAIYGDDQPFPANRLLTVRRYADREDNSLWRTFNIVQENALKGGIRYYKNDESGRLKAHTTRAVKNIKRDVNLNQALHQLAAAMIELKN
jgi:hypothetical protein